MRFIKAYKHSTFNIHDPIDTRFLPRLRLDFSQINQYKF